jgi:hypothetical protein
MGTLIIGWTLYLIGWSVLGVSLIAGPFWAPAAGFDKLLLGGVLDILGCLAVALGSHHLAIRTLGILNFLLGAGILALTVCASFGSTAVSGWGTPAVAVVLIVAGIAVYFTSDLLSPANGLAEP